MQVNLDIFGQVNNQQVDLITIQNSRQTSIQITNYGCIVTSIKTEDRNHHIDDIVLGYESLDKYVQGHPFFGAIAGRFANRINNGRFSIDGKLYQLECNEVTTNQHLHGGNKGFDKYVWAYDIEENTDKIMVHFHRVSVDNESGYPGNLFVTHSIGLDENNQIYYDFRAITDKPTIVNLANHSYYNLSGYNHSSIVDHELKVFSDFYTPVNGKLIPTGEILSVSGTHLDFREFAKIGDNMRKHPTGEIDHNFILKGEMFNKDYKFAAELYDPNSGRCMTVITTQPALQIYNGSKLSNKCWIGRNGFRYESFQGICFETQHYPDSPNFVHFPSCLLKPNHVYEQKNIHKLAVR
ncbi:aldose epimerase family protein [Basfia succiniciproducens]|uniref:Aldose 1-epimerase n=1 Tax=Basfia succiniciproducens TaxID=653940 RepID=A0A1G5B904_9PAST|nr:aldose epimerase family protein [Basfia succiniciproducens]QIM68033.1 galactose mutarotase [Basfia succiniciproducens]SCX86623.1 aldose 1-epimerase [Basfia succiniciproducens]